MHTVCIFSFVFWFVEEHCAHWVPKGVCYGFSMLILIKRVESSGMDRVPHYDCRVCTFVQVFIVFNEIFTHSGTFCIDCLSIHADSYTIAIVHQVTSIWNRNLNGKFVHLFVFLKITPSTVTKFQWLILRGLWKSTTLSLLAFICLSTILVWCTGSGTRADCKPVCGKKDRRKQTAVELVVRRAQSEEKKVRHRIVRILWRKAHYAYLVWCGQCFFLVFL